MKKFEWKATESAPSGYPMQIVSGMLYYHKQDGGLYVPNMSTIHGGWGRGLSSHVVGEELKPLPDKLSIRFFSYTENQFYQGEFALPYQKLLQLFQDGYYSPNEEGHTTYSSIIVGVAPGGSVSVWLWGFDKITEVFTGRADKIEGDWGWINRNPDISREEYVKIGIEEALKTPEAVAKLKKNGVPVNRWADYRVRYVWQPAFVNLPLLDARIESVKFFNGERDYINYPIEKNNEGQTRAVLSELVFVWDRPKRKPLMVELYFNEQEIFTAFKQLSASNHPLKLEMRLDWVDKDNQFSIWLRNEKESIEIKKTRIETYGIPERNN